MLTPGASGMRKGIEERSAVAMAFLYQLPRWALPIGLAALLIAGLAISGVIGAVIILVLTVFLGWLAYLSWPSIGAQARVLRVAAAVVLIGLAVLQLVL
jgi:hypothetical protein